MEPESSIEIPWWRQPASPGPPALEGADSIYVKIIDPVTYDITQDGYFPSNFIVADVLEFLYRRYKWDRGSHPVCFGHKDSAISEHLGVKEAAIYFTGAEKILIIWMTHATALFTNFIDTLLRREGIDIVDSKPYRFPKELFASYNLDDEEFMR